MELYVGEFDYQVGSLENQWTAGITAVGNVRDWIDVRGFHCRWYLESRQRRDTTADV